jgi:tripartite-type tricarboxylate transporter receptor subunit TctC
MTCSVYQRVEITDSIESNTAKRMLTTMTPFRPAAILLVLGTLAAGLLPRYVTPAAAQPDFRGETISIQIGYGPGGGYDTYGRVLARHFGRFIPGNPNVVAKNMPGAGSLRAANYVYNLTARDPVDVALFSASTAMEPLMGNEQAKFEVTRFGWLGSMNQDISFCGVWRAPGIPMSLEDMLKPGGKELIFGSAGPAAISHQHPLILKNVLKANIRVISGYEGQKQVNLAMQRGEVHGACALFASSIKAQWLPNVKSGELKLFVQMGPKVSNEFGPVANVFDFVHNDEDRKVLEFHFKQTILGRPFAASPNLPKDRLAALQSAFLATMKDPQFLADAKKYNLDIDVATPDEVQRLLADFSGYPKPVLDRAKAAIGR